MIKNLLVLAIVSVFFISCGEQQKSTNNEADGNEAVAELVEVTPDNFYDKAEELVGMDISLKGTIDHVCKHGGKKMMVFGTDPDIRVKITTGEDMAAFDSDWNGSDVIAIGTVEEFRIDEEYLAEWENDVNEQVAEEEFEHSEDKPGIHKGESEKEHSATDEFEQIENYRQEIAESGTDHISFYSIICKEYEIIEGTSNDVDTTDHDHDGDDHDHNHE